jgi:hypothetical protein
LFWRNPLDNSGFFYYVKIQGNFSER